MSRIFKINVNGTEYDVIVQEMTDVSTQLMPQYRASTVAAPSAPAVSAAPAASVSKAAPAGSGDQCAQMGGVIASILVTVGQSVAVGDQLVELEAMKMKVPVLATRAGQVSRILVALGDAVERGQAVISLS